MKTTTPHNSFFLKTNSKFLRILFSEVLYIEAVKKYVLVVTQEKKYLIQISLNHTEEILPCNHFCRINKSHIISLQNISEFDNNAVYIGKKKLPLGRLYKKKLMERLIILDKTIIIEPNLSNRTIDNVLLNN